MRYKARDGMEIPAYLTLPKGVAPKNLPMIMLPHGGPWARDAWGYDPYTQFLANRGYAVLQPNFRGSAGYGKRFLNAGNKEWGFGAMQHDLTDGVNELVKQGIADPKRIGIFGGSYGGYATLAGVTFTPALYAAAVPYVAPSNLITLIESFPAYWGPYIKIWHKRVGDPASASDKADLMARSPLFKAEQIKTPMLVVHGANDPRVKKTESDQIVVALRERGLSVEYIVAPDEGHGFRAPENRLALAAAMEKFLAKHLGGRNQQEVSAELSAKLAALTVDVKSVALMDKTLASYAETAPLPLRAPEKVQPAELQYSSTIEAGGQKFQMEVGRKVEAVQWQGASLWRIISSTQSPMGAAADTFYLDQQSLLPVHRSSSQGPAIVTVQYLAEAIKGSMRMGAQEVPIEVKLAAPVLGDGAALEVTLAALPLAPNYETTIRVFELVSRKIRPLSLKVTGMETVTVKAGAFETFKVEMKPLDGEAGGGVLNVSSDKNRRVVRSFANLPAMTGGGTVTTELVNIGTAPPN
jgi:dienelactone hydrolase